MHVGLPVVRYLFGAFFGRETLAQRLREPLFSTIFIAIYRRFSGNGRGNLSRIAEPTRFALSPIALEAILRTTEHRGDAQKPNGYMGQFLAL